MTTINADKIRRQVLEVLSEASYKPGEETGFTVEEIRDDMLLQADLGIGTVIGDAEFLDLRKTLEDTLGVKITEDKLPSHAGLAGLRVADVVNFFST